MFQHTAARRRLGLPNQTEQKNDRFNTQPPEGGWAQHTPPTKWAWTFQHTAARRRLAQDREKQHIRDIVSTHSRPKAAGESNGEENGSGEVSTHSRPKAAGYHYSENADTYLVSTHSRPKAAGKAGFEQLKSWLFQHTAARRRLVLYMAICA